MGRPKLSNKIRKSRMVSVRLREETYKRLLEEAGTARKVPEVLRRKAETA